MSFQLGKSEIKSIEGKVTIYQPTNNGSKKPVATLKVTTRVLPKSEFIDLTVNTASDCELCKALVIDIKPGDENTQAVDYSPELMDEIFEFEWQSLPILEFVMKANSERMARALQLKN